MPMILEPKHKDARRSAFKIEVNGGVAHTHAETVPVGYTYLHPCVHTQRFTLDTPVWVFHPHVRCHSVKS